jgi:hypothetical protein
MLQSAAGILFFWSFELLVFLILLNFLLAIIVDAFGEVKEQQKEQTGAAWRCVCVQMLHVPESGDGD